jgi:RNA polymerase sigma-70 factor (ECF subfamily)
VGAAPATATTAPAGTATGGDAAFVAVLEAHDALLSRLVATYEADPARREELGQDVRLAIWQALPAFRGTSSLRTFIARIAHNRCVTHVAREARLRPLAGGRPDTDAPDALAGTPDHQPHLQLQAEQTFSALLDAVAALPLGPRQVISLALEGFTPEEIAATLGITRNNVAVRMNRARAALEKVLRP